MYIQSVGAQAIDFISCIIFKTLLGVVDELKALDKNVYKRWKASVLIPSPVPSNYTSSMFSSAKNCVNGAPSPLIDLNFLSELLEEKMEYLEPYNYYRLLVLCADKVVMIYLNLLKDAYSSGKTIQSDGPEVTQLRIDITAVQECFRSACNHKDLANYADAVSGHFRPLNYALSLISDSKFSPEFEKTLQSIFKVAGGHTEDADALASFTLCCVQLRYDTKQSMFSQKKEKEVKAPVHVEKSVGIHIHIYIYVYIYICIYIIYMHVYIYLYVYIFIYMHM
jgi:hypothetical protein